MSSNKEVLEFAQMHMECLNEAWNEFNEGISELKNERMLVLHHEIRARLWAAIYLVQGVASGVPLSADQCATVEEALAYDDPHEEFDDDDDDEDEDDAVPVMRKH